ncbi:MAG: cell division protein FtsQ/DivIB [Bacteroidales bacterium]|jgi:cell division protein FtsQ|nr:cell division protein FtsQ/DivIB [Bacteroidales bacterium]
MKKITAILLLLPTLYLVAVPVYYACKTLKKPFTGINITIADSSEYHFVTHNRILNLIGNNNGKIIGKPVGELRLSDIENDLISLRELKVAEVYVTAEGALNVYADQRDPVMRVMANNGGDYYIDNEGIVIRRRNLYTPRLHIVGGNVNISQAMLDGVSVLDTSIKNSILKDIYYLVDYINSDSFWSAQIDQIYVDGNDEIDLIPRVGNHMIHLGTADNFMDKLRNLREFYDKVLPVVGWNRYSVINLAFSDQIVCRRR